MRKWAVTILILASAGLGLADEIKKFATYPEMDNRLDPQRQLKQAVSVANPIDKTARSERETCFNKR